MTAKTWIGSAAKITDVWTPSLSGTVTSQTYSLTINNKSVTYTSSGIDTVSTILFAIQNAWNASIIPEFQELTAAALPVGGPYTSLTLTQDIPGRPTVITVATGGAATFTITNTTAATGPNDFGNAQNWSTNTSPANSDVLSFSYGNVPCWYGLNTSLTGVTVNVDPGYSGQIGLPYMNSGGYSEYRATGLTLAGGTALINSSGINRVNLAFGSNLATVRILNTGNRTDQYTPVCLITGGNNSSVLDITKGDVGVAYYAGQVAQFSSVLTTYATNIQSDVRLTIGPGCTLATLNNNGGAVTLRCNATTVNRYASGGTLTITDSAAITTLNVSGGIVFLNSIGTITTCNLYETATLNCNGDPRGKTIGTLNVDSASVTIIDSQKSINSGVLTLVTSGLPSVQVDHGNNTQIVYT